MLYRQILPGIHLLLQPLDRKKLELELIFSSGGSWFEEAQDRGKKHLMEHCIASRTSELDFRALKDYEYRENIMINAYTGPITMGLTATGHYSDAQKMLAILLEMAFEPTFDQEILDREKDIVLREISERRGDPGYRLHFDTMKHVFTPESYSNHEVLGDSDRVAETTIADFHKLHRQNLEASHIILMMSGGGIDENMVMKALNPFVQKYTKQESVHTNAVNFQAPNSFQPFVKLPVVHELAHSHAELSIFLPCKVDYQNKPALQIFENLFLRYGGALYDRLRDELGLVYHVQSSFDYNLQVLDIYLSCEIKYITQILDEINKVFSNFDENFKPEKFAEFKNIIQKKQDIAQDTLGVGTSFTQNSLRLYGIPETYDEYAVRLAAVESSDIQDIYQNIQSQLAKRRVVMVSKDPAIENV